MTEATSGHRLALGPMYLVAVEKWLEASACKTLASRIGQSKPYGSSYSCNKHVGAVAGFMPWASAT